MAEPPDSFAALLAQADSVSMPRRGDLMRGVILSIDSQGAIVDLGLKLDGVIPRADLDRLPAEIAPKRAWTYRQVAWLAQRQGTTLELPRPIRSTRSRCSASQKRGL